MRVIAKKPLRDFLEKHADAEEELRAWYKEAERADWNTFLEIRHKYKDADSVGDQGFRKRDYLIFSQERESPARPKFVPFMMDWGYRCSICFVEVILRRKLLWNLDLVLIFPIFSLHGRTVWRASRVTAGAVLTMRGRKKRWITGSPARHEHQSSYLYRCCRIDFGSCYLRKLSLERTNTVLP